jgi:hypothetical protein
MVMTSVEHFSHAWKLCPHGSAARAVMNNFTLTHGWSVHAHLGERARECVQAYTNHGIHNLSYRLPATLFLLLF